MKNQFLSLLFASILFWSCNSKKEETNLSTAIPDTIVTHDNHIIKNAADINGTYTGTVPCGDCEGIETKIQLNSDYTYVMKTKYLGRDTKKVFEDKGRYSIDSDKMILSLEGANKYTFNTTSLIQLDSDENIVTGEHADQYILKKE